MNVGGNLLDVQFKDGACFGLYGLCKGPDAFVFDSEATATAASEALRNQVFLDGPSGNFDTDPGLTAGIGDGTQYGSVITRYGIQSGKLLIVFLQQSVDEAFDYTLASYLPSMLTNTITFGGTYSRSGHRAPRCRNRRRVGGCWGARSVGLKSQARALESLEFKMAFGSIQSERPGLPGLLLFVACARRTWDGPPAFDRARNLGYGFMGDCGSPGSVSDRQRKGRVDASRASLEAYGPQRCTSMELEPRSSSNLVRRSMRNRSWTVAHGKRRFVSDIPGEGRRSYAG